MNLRPFPLIGILAASALIVAPLLTGHGPRLMWNASASVPLGLYAVMPVDRIEVGDLVAVSPPGELAAFLAERGYLPRGVPLIKRVLALPGTEICRHGLTIIAHGRARRCRAAGRAAGRSPRARCS